MTRKSQLVSILKSFERFESKIFYRGLRFEKHFQSCYIVHEFCIFLSDIAIDDSENFKRLLSNEWLLTPFVVFTNEKKEIWEQLALQRSSIHGWKLCPMTSVPGASEEKPRCLVFYCRLSV